MQEIRITYYLRPGYFKRILGRKNKSPEWLAQQLSTTTGYVYLLILGHRSVATEKRDRIMEIFKGQPWDKIFRIKERQII